jgi:phage gp16-like protein
LCEEEANGGKKILGWQKKWYLQASHKRLGRILVEFAKSYKLYKFGFGLGLLK